jgi:hypothetical protein
MSDELRDLAADLNKAAVKVFPAVAAVVAKGAHNVKEQMAEEAQSSGSYKHFHRSIGYDLHKGGLEAEIGPDKNGPQGALGNILYFGTSKNAAILDVESGLRDEAPRFEKHIADAAEKSLGL